MMNIKKSKAAAYVTLLVATFCALCLACTISASAAESDYNLWVDGTQVTAQNAADVLGDGTVSYDAATNTLTLSGANITEVHTADIFTAGIYAEIADLTIDLVGENRITVPIHDGGLPDGSEVAVASTKNIEISGTGKLWSNTYVVTCMQDVVIKNCEISSDWICLSAMGDVTVEDATISGKAGLVGTEAGDITLKNTNVPDGGNYIGMYTETGDITIENCNMTIHGAAVDEETIPIAVGEGGGTLTVKNSVLDIKSNSYAILSPAGGCVFENVEGKLDVMGEFAYAMLFGGIVSMSGCELDITCRATEDAACGICAMQDIGIEDSRIKIDARTAKETAACIGGIESPGANVDIWESTLELKASGPCALGIYAENVKLNHSITTVEASANPSNGGFAAGVASALGKMRIKGGLLDVLATGPVDHEGPATVGIFMGNDILAPEFIEADVKLRGNQAISTSPDLSIYGREYELIAATEVNGEGALELNKDNIESIRYLHIHPFYAIYFDANGGTGEMEAVLKHYGSYVLPENEFVAPEGKTFRGWATSADGEVIADASFVPHADVDLYAIWEDKVVVPDDNTPDDNTPDDNTPDDNAPDNNDPDIDAHTHSYGTEWSSDGESHWKECSCGDKKYSSAHTDTNENGSCDICGFVMHSSPKKGLGAGAIVGIVLGSVAAAGIGGFSLIWFVIKKKSFADLVAVFKKK